MVHGDGGDGGDVTIEYRASVLSRVRQKNSLNGVLDLTV
jgi:hypothetical protein